MPPRTLASLAHALSVAPDLDATIVALGEGLAELDRAAHMALLRYDGRREMLRDRLTPAGGRVERSPIEMTFDHIPAPLRLAVAAGGELVDFADKSDEFARFFGMHSLQEGGLLSLRGLRVEGRLAAIVALYEPKKIFGSRTSERFAPHVGLFELAFLRFAEQEAREEAVKALEEITQRTHAEYERRLAELEQQMRNAAGGVPGAADPAHVVALQRDAARAAEDARRANRRLEAAEQQVGMAVEQLERAHIELHRRSESLRQKTRTLYLLERLLGVASSVNDPRHLVDGLLSLVGDDLKAQRCSLMLRVPDEDMLYLAAARGIAPNVQEGYRVPLGYGVAGHVAVSRQPLLVEDVNDAKNHPLLADQYFTTGSFISFPLVYHDELIGVVNLTNRAQRGVYVEEDVERVRLLALVIAVVASHARLPERLLEHIGA